MTNRPLVVISLEGLATAALGCYGSSWNRTPALDAVAASGCVWDRWIATSDDPHHLLRQVAECGSWAAPWRTLGSVEILTDVALGAQVDNGPGFDQVKTIAYQDPADAGLPAGDMVDTQLGQLIAAAINRDSQEQPWGVLWLHSDFLTRRWDAPRELLPPDEVDVEFDEPIDPAEAAGDISFGFPEDSAPIPSYFDSTTPPCIKLDEKSHPDLVTSWMRTYACQIRLVDVLIEVLLTSLEMEDPFLVVLGTSGFRLGQGGWIGHRQGPLRSPDIHLPLIVSDCGPLRISQLSSSDGLTAALRELGQQDGRMFDGSSWSSGDELSEIRTASDRAMLAMTTPKWFFARDLDASEHLFYKPDDIADFNDVARLRGDVIERLDEERKNPAGD